MHVDLIYGPNHLSFALAGIELGMVRQSIGPLLNLSRIAVAYVSGVEVAGSYVLLPGDRVEFYKDLGRKGGDLNRRRDKNDDKEAVYVPAGAPSWVNKTLIGQTLDTWQPYYKERLTSEDAFEIIMNISRYWEVVREWERQ